MAGPNDIKIGLTLEANNIKETVKDTDQINANLQAAGVAAAKIRVPSALAAAQQGVAARQAQGQTARQAQGQAASDSNMSRGVTGSTGAAGRDFAAQAAGLGGLVHVYATFAANIYAASAAFGALKEAMNTLHLQQGIEQLSAQSGKNLTSLAANLNLVTDGALTMKAAFTSVANASAVGMTNKQILQMGEVAKKASQAMGWDMADAMDRLTKGIGKNRPQLLDELGIIVSANQIYQDYGRQVGKTALTLTDYEKKQAFANAVLQQGIDKFGAIDIPTNPFNKLEAAAANTMQSLLGFIDKGLGPVVKYLAMSPTGLAIAMASIGGILLKQAIPALSAWRENARKAADDAAKLAKDIHVQFEAFDIRRKLDLAGPAAQAATAEANAHIAGVQTALVKALGSKSKLLKDAMSGTFDAADGEKRIATQAKATETYIASLQAARATIVQTDTVHLAAMDADIAKQKEKLGYLKQAQLLAGMAKNPQQAATSIMDSAENEAAMASRFGSQGWQREKNANRAQNSANRRATMANVATNTQIMGVGGAFKELLDDTKNGAKSFNEIDGSMTRAATTSGIFGKSITFAAGGLRILGSAAMTAMAAFSEITIVLAVLGALYSVFDAWVSKGTEQQDAFNAKLVEGNAAVKTAADALEYLGKKSKDAIGIIAITAMTNAIDGLSTAIEGQIDTYNKWGKAVQGSGGWWDKAKDSIAGIFGKSNLDDLAKNMGTELEAIANSLVFTPKLKDKFQTGIADLLHIDKGSSADAISKALSSQLDNASTAGKESLLKSFNSLIAKTKEEDAASTAASKSMLDGLKAVEQEVDVITNKLQFKDGIGKLGSLVEQLGMQITEAMKNPEKSLEGLVKIIESPKVQALLMMGGKDTSGIIGSLDKINQVQQVLKDTMAAQASADATIASLKKDGKFTTTAYGSLATHRQYGSNTEEADNALKAKGMADLNAKNARELAGKTEKEVLGKPLADLNAIGQKFIDVALKDAISKAELVKATSDLSSAQKAGLVTTKEELAIKLKELSYKEQEVTMAFDYAIAIQKSQDLMEENNALLAASNLSLSDEQRSAAQNTLAVITVAKLLKEGKLTSTTGIPDDIVNQANKRNLATKTLVAKRDSALAPLKAEEYVAKEASALKIQHDRNTLQQAWVKNQTSITAQNLLDLSLQEKYSAGYNKTLADRRMGLEIAQANNTYETESLTIASKEIDLFNKNSNQRLEGYQQKIDELAIEKQLAISKRDTAKIAAEMTKLNAELTSKLAIQKLSQDASIANAQNSLTITSLGLDLETTKLNQMKEQGAISDTLYNAKVAQLAIDKAQGEYNFKSLENTIALQQAQDEYNAKLKEAQELARKTAEMAAKQYNSTARGPQLDVTAAGNSAADSARVSDQVQATYDATQNKLSGISELNNKQLEFQTKQITLQQTYLDLLNRQTTVQKGLTTLFGDMGNKFGTVIKAFDKLKSIDNNGSKAIKEQKDKIALLNENAKLLEKSGKSTTKIDKERLDAEGKLGDLEQQNTLDKIDGIGAIAGATKDMFEKGSNASKAMAAVEKTTAMITTGAAIAKLVEQSGWFGFAGAAALVALLATFGITGGGSAPTGMDSASKQKAQGTGQSYDSAGNINDNGGGKLGNSSALTTTIKDGIDLLNKTNFELLDFNKGDTYKALIAIRDNTENFVKSLASTSGITGGNSPFGSVNGGNKGFLSIGGLFSSSSEIVDTGIKVTGAISELLKGLGSKTQYETVHSSSSGFFGFGGSDSTNINSKNLPVNVDKYITGIIQGFNATLMSAADVLGSSSAAVQSALSSFNFTLEVSAKGMTGQEFADAVMAQIGIQLDLAANKAFPNLAGLASQFQHFGESSSDFVIRLLNDTKNVALALDSIGKVFDPASIAQSAEVLVKAAGGLDNFVAATSNFSDKFLSESEKLAPVSKAVEAAFKKLNITMPTTRDGFKNLILGFKVVDQATADTFNTLLGLASAFDQLNPITVKTLSILDLQKAKLTQQIDIYNLQGKTAEALTLQRKDELAQMDERLRAGQLYVYALQDEVALKDKLKTAYSAESSVLNTTITNLKAGVKSLNDYKLSLNMGAQSNLTSQEKYQQAKSQVADTLAIATSIIDKTKSTDQQALDTQAKNNAISQLPAVSTSFLDASKAIYASSEMYNQDFSYIQDLISSTSTIIGAQQTDAEKQLDQLKTQVGALIDISTKVDTTNEILTRLEFAQQNTKATAPGASDSGLVVNSAPASPIESFFGQLIAQVKDLTKQVTDLRLEQTVHTQNIIVSNATTQAAAAETITQGVDETISKNWWDSSAIYA